MEQSVTKRKTIYNIIIFLIGIFDIAYGVYYHHEKKEEMASRVKVSANVHQVTTSSKDKTLYLDYYIKDKKYNSVIVVNKNEKIGYSINVYCLESNPTECLLENKNYNGYYIIGLGILILLINMIGFFKKI